MKEIDLEYQTKRWRRLLGPNTVVVIHDSTPEQKQKMGLYNIVEIASKPVSNYWEELHKKLDNPS